VTLADSVTKDYPLRHNWLCFCVVHRRYHLRRTSSALRYCDRSAYSGVQAIRAFRHPERYGPRRADPTNPDDGFGTQSRAKGLARAVLDTFPIVKFNASEDEARRAKDEETRGMELSHWEVVDTPKASRESGSSEQKMQSEKSPSNRTPTEEKSSDDQSPRTGLKRNGTQASRQNPDVTPQTIGRETCPICIVDFEEGDDLRVLPCEGKHRFHQACVDPWLLELSSSCPLCREGKQ